MANSSKTSAKRTRGDYGEQVTCDYLFERGYEIVARNYRKRVGEIDLIATDKQTLTFVEVKTRKFGSLTDGIDSVTRDKQRKLVRTAKAFLSENPQLLNLSIQFDVAIVTVTTDEAPRLLELEYLSNAFNPVFL